MVKKILLSITCGVVAVSMCACASSTAILNQAQDVVTDNIGEIESYLPNELVQVITAGISAEGEIAPQEETTVSSESSDTAQAPEDVTAAEIAEAPEDVTAAEIEEEAAVAELGEEAAAAEIVEEATSVEEPAADTEIAAEEETKILLNDDPSEAEEETSVEAPAEEETKEDSLIAPNEEETKEDSLIAPEEETAETEETVIFLGDGKAKVNGNEVKDNSSADIYISNDITYYEDKDTYSSGNAYGEGILTDKHTADEAAKNPVLNITKAGTYRLAGDWDGQVRVDLGEGAKTDKNAKVVLILDGVTIECTVAPAILFKNVYEAYTEEIPAQDDLDTEDITADSSDKEDSAIDFFGKEDTDSETSDKDDAVTDADDEENPLSSFFGDDENKEDETDADSYFEDLFNSMNQEDANDNQDTAKPSDESEMSMEDLQNLLEFFSMISQYQEQDANTANPFGDLPAYDASEDKEDTADNPFSDLNTDDDKDTQDSTDNPFSDLFTDDAYEDTQDTTDNPFSDLFTDDAFGTTDDLFGETQDSMTMSVIQNFSAQDAGAMICIADGSESKIFGSHVAKIYNDSKDGSELTKQDGAITSDVSLGILSEEEGSGSLSIVADKEGIETQRHLIIDAGNLDILSQDDGINASEDNVSAVVINGGLLHIYAGTGTEGDAIDSNGWILVNGGRTIASANPAADSALDSTCASYVNGGEIVGFGSSKDLASEESLATTINLRFAKAQSVQDDIVIKDKSGKTVYELKASEDEMLSALDREYTGLVFSAPEIETGETYFLYIGDEQMAYSGIEEAVAPDELPGEITPVESPEEETVVGNETEKETIASSETETANNPFVKEDETDQSATDAIEEDLDVLQDYAVIFEHFGISMDEVEDYLNEEASDSNASDVKPSDDDSTGTNPMDNNDSDVKPEDSFPNGFGGMAPFGGDKPDKPDGTRPENPEGNLPDNPFATANQDDVLDGQQAPAGELSVDFVMNKDVVTFLGVQPMSAEVTTEAAAADDKDAIGTDDDKDAIGSADDKDAVEEKDPIFATDEKDAAEDADEKENDILPVTETETSAEETTVASGTTTPTEEETAMESETQKSEPKDAGLEEDSKIGVGPDGFKSGGISLPFAIAQQSRGVGLAPAEIEEADPFLQYQMTKVRAVR